MVRAPKLAALVAAGLLLLGSAPFVAHGSLGGQGASTVIGQPDYTANSTSTAKSGLSHPDEAVFDSHGDLWLTDTANNRVLEFAAPLSTGEAASLVIGQPGFTTNGLATSQTGLSQPEGLAFDSNGDLWVVDYGNNRVLEFLAPLSTGEAASVVIGQPDFASNSSSTTQSRLFGPEGLAFDSSGDLWVADSGNSRVLEFRAPLTTGEPASLVLGQLNFTYRLPWTAPNRMFIPTALAFDTGGNLWVADSGNCRILEFSPPFSSGEDASLVLGKTNFTTNETTTSVSPFSGRTVAYQFSTSELGMHFPEDISFDSQGNLWVADTTNNRVVEYKAPLSTGNYVYREIGQLNFTTNSSATTAEGLFHPEGVAFDSQGNLWIVDSFNSRVVEYASPQTAGSLYTGPPYSPPYLLVGVVLVAFALVASYLFVRRWRASRTLKGASLIRALPLH